jgi:hypothetical protein
MTASQSESSLLNRFKSPFRLIFRKVVQLNAQLSGKKYRYVFVLGHMRSGSTLLSHILASHPAFEYAGELYKTYKTSADFQALVVEICRRLHKVRLRSTFVMDKIVYDGFIADDAVLKSPLLYKCVILVREPETAIKSMIDHYGWQEPEALGNYLARLGTLAHQSVILGDRALYIEYEDLVQFTEDTLSALTAFFGVSPPFVPNYKTDRMTGEKVGDTSENIWAGRVIKTRPHNVEISAATIAEAQKAVTKFRQELRIAGVRFANERTDSTVR